MKSTNQVPEAAASIKFCVPAPMADSDIESCNPGYPCLQIRAFGNNTVGEVAGSFVSHSHYTATLQPATETEICCVNRIPSFPDAIQENQGENDAEAGDTDHTVGQFGSLQKTDTEQLNRAGAPGSNPIPNDARMHWHLYPIAVVDNSTQKSALYLNETDRGTDGVAHQVGSMDCSMRSGATATVGSTRCHPFPLSTLRPRHGHRTGVRSGNRLWVDLTTPDSHRPPGRGYRRSASTA